MELIKTLLKDSPSSILNLGICFAVFISGLYFLFQLKKTRNATNEDLSFIPTAFSFWLISWLVWCCLWGLKLFNPLERVMIILGDLNTLFLILFYFSFTRGKDASKNDLWKIGLKVASFLVVSNLFFSYFPILFGSESANAKIGEILHENWSLTLSMSSTVIVGWSFKLRHNSSWVLLIGLIYAISQPVAYFLLFQNVDIQDSTKRFFSVQVSENYLLCLALLKASWALSVTYYIGRIPKTSDSLISIPKANEIHDFFPDQFVQPNKIRRLIDEKKDEQPFKYISEKLSKDFEQFTEFMATDNLPEDKQRLFKDKITGVFNEILKEVAFDKEVLHSVTISKQTQIFKDEETRSLDKYNRSLLEDLFKEEISSSFWFINNWKKSVSVLGFVLSFVGLIFTLCRMMLLSELSDSSISWNTIVSALTTCIVFVLSLLNYRTARLNLSTALAKQKEKK